MSVSRGEVMWAPDPDAAASTQMARFRRFLADRGLLTADDYDALWQWSVTDVGAFWAALAAFVDVHFHQPPASALVDGVMPGGAQWFPGATLNYAEHALRSGPGKGDDDVAIVAHTEAGPPHSVTYGELRRDVAAFRAALVSFGVQRGDRVAGLVPNCVEAVVAFLAVASLGAIWSSCSPEFGVRAVQDRFAQIEPVVLIAVNEYSYGGRQHDVRPTVQELQRAMPSLRATVLIDHGGGSGARRNVSYAWDGLLADHAGADLEFEPVPFDHPLWVLYSSGTTGLPKGIVHGHGGIVLEHLKSLALHFDLKPGDRFFWFTTTGWMMWNFLVSGLLVGATVVLYDGSPAHPRLRSLWERAAEGKWTVFGTSAPWVHALVKAEVSLADLDLSSVRVVGVTGAPLSADGFGWLGSQLGPRVQVGSFSGGTDLCTGFIGPSPDVPVWRGELSRPSLGAAVAAFDPSGEPVMGTMGELVLTRPMPSMPVSLWGDDDGSRLREAYFDYFPGVWRHGDWITITPRGSVVIHGRSDSTLNRGGVRMGTAEFYRVLEAHPAVADSLVIDTSGPSDVDGRLLCFVVLTAGAVLTEVDPELRAALRRELSPRHVPDEFVAVDAIPHTLNGKKCEVPVKRILAGADPATAVSRDALQDPSALDEFIAFGRS